MNFTVVVIFSVFAFGTGYVVGQAQRFGFFKFLIVLVFAGGFLTSGNDYYTMGVIFSFFAGLLVAKDIISFDMLDNLRYRLSSIAQLYQRTGKAGQEEESRQGNSDYQSEEVRREQERRQEEGRQRRKKEDFNVGDFFGGSGKNEKKQKEKKKSDHQKSSENRKKQDYSRQNEQKQRDKVEVKPDLRTPEQIIGVSGNYTKEELRKAYRRACSRCHSDKFANMSDSFKKELDEEFKKVQKAYEVLVKRLY